MSWDTKRISIKAEDNIKQLPNMPCKDGVQLKANSKNSDGIYLAKNEASFNGDDTSYPMDASDTLFLPVKNLSEICIKTDAIEEQWLHMVIP